MQLVHEPTSTRLSVAAQQAEVVTVSETFVQVSKSEYHSRERPSRFLVAAPERDNALLTATDRLSTQQMAMAAWSFVRMSNMSILISFGLYSSVCLIPGCKRP